jgi:hypothetical protein
MTSAVKYAILLAGEEELFGYIECESEPSFGMLLDAFQGESTQAMLLERQHLITFHALH